MENKFHFDPANELRKINDLQVLSDIAFIVANNVGYNKRARRDTDYLSSLMSQCEADNDTMAAAEIIRSKYSYMFINQLRHDEQLTKCIILDAYEAADDTDYDHLYELYFSHLMNILTKTTLNIACRLIKFKALYDTHDSYNIEKRFVHRAAQFTFNFIIGPAGSGKTTIIKRLQKFYNIAPTDGTFNKTYFVKDNTFIFDGDSFFVSTNSEFYQSPTAIIEAILYYNEKHTDILLRNCEIRYNGEIRHVFVCLTDNQSEIYIRSFIKEFRDKYTPMHHDFDRLSLFTGKIRFHVNLYYLVSNYTTRINALEKRIQSESHSYISMYKEEIIKLNDMKYRCHKLIKFMTSFLPTGYFDDYSGHTDIRSTTHMLYIENQSELSSTNGRA